MKLRDEFPEDVKLLLARRSGFRCSNPECRQPTAGPTEDPTKASSIGVAAHITAAAPGGPRFASLLSQEERRASANGIWLCQNHAKLVDDDPQRYTVELLREWKRLAEQAARLELESPLSGDQREHPATRSDLLEGIRDAIIDSTRQHLDGGGERPRFVGALRELFTRLRACHDAYMKYTDNDKYTRMRVAWDYHGPDWSSERAIARRLSEELGPFRDEWLDSVDSLVATIWAQRDALQIFDPGLYDLLDSYTAGEAEFYLNKEKTDEARLAKFRKYLREREHWARKDAAPFAEVVRSLREFISRYVHVSELY